MAPTRNICSELSFILNLGILAVATIYVKLSGGSQAAVAYTSVGIAFLTFVGIIIYHIYTQIKSKVKYIWRGTQLQHENNISISENLCHQPKATPNVTHTEVDLHELWSPLDLLSYHQMNWFYNNATIKHSKCCNLFACQLCLLFFYMLLRFKCLGVKLCTTPF